MSLWRSLYRGETEFDFMRYRYRYFVISGALIAISLLSLLVRGLDGSVDFTGGTIVEAPNTTGVDVAEYRGELSAIGQEGARVQIRSERDGSEVVVVQTEALSVGDRNALVATCLLYTSDAADDN